MQRAPDRIVAAVLGAAQRDRPELPDHSYNNNMKGWGPELCARRPDITMEMVDDFLTNMYRERADFVYTVTRDFVRSCQTPMLVLPDDTPRHPYAVAMEIACARAEVRSERLSLEGAQGPDSAKRCNTCASSSGSTDPRWLEGGSGHEHWCPGSRGSHS